MHARAIWLFYESIMDDLIGFLELLAWILSVVFLAALVTYAVIKVTQRFERKPETPPDADATSGSS